MVLLPKILQKKKGLNGRQDWQKLDCHCKLRKEAEKGNGKKADVLIARLGLFQVSLPALAPSALSWAWLGPQAPRIQQN
jgi:hypothetical protein